MGNWEGLIRRIATQLQQRRNLSREEAMLAVRQMTPADLKAFMRARFDEAKAPAKARWQREARQIRRNSRCCADCGTYARAYRCEECAFRHKLRRLRKTA